MENSNRPVSGVLHHAVATGDITTVQSLLKQGVDADTPLYYNGEVLKRTSQLSMSSLVARKNTTGSMSSLVARKNTIGSMTDQLSVHQGESISVSETISDQHEDNIKAYSPVLIEVNEIEDDESGYATLVRNDNNEKPTSRLIPLKTDDNNEGKSTSFNNNNRRSIAESIDERLHDDNETLIERSSSLEKSKTTNANTEEMLAEEKHIKLIPRIKRKISFKWNRKYPKKGEKLDEEDFYENVSKMKVRNVDDEQLNENYEGIAFFEAVRDGMDMIVQTLLETSNNYQLNTPDEDGFSPVMQAAWHGQKYCLQILLDHGANTLLENATGCTAAHFAAGQGHFECLELLIKDGQINVNAKTKFGATALILAAKGGHQEAVELLLDNGADPNIQYRGNQNALLFAAGNGHYECLQALVSHEVQIDQSNSQKVTPLMRAVQQGHNPCVVLLIDNGAGVDKQDAIGRSAIHFAVEYDNPKALKLLLEAGAHPQLKTKGESTPLAYSERFQNKKCADMLETRIKALKEKLLLEKDVPDAMETKVTCINFRMLFRRKKV